MPLNFDLGRIRGRRGKSGGGARLEGALGEAAAAPQTRKDPRGKWKVALGVLAAANVLAFFLLVRPVGGSTADLEEQLRTLRQQVQRKQVAARQLRDIVKKVDTARAAQDKFIAEFFMDRRTASSTILSEIGDCARQAGLKPREHAFVPFEPVEGTDDLGMMTITANYEATYGQLVHFVNLVDRSKRFLIIDNIQAAPQQNSALLNARFKINAFLREIARPPAFPPPPAAQQQPEQQQQPATTGVAVAAPAKPSPVGEVRK